MNRKLCAVALLGAIAVAAGAIGSHAVKSRVSATDLEIWKTAAHYHLIHAVALFGLVNHDQENRYRKTLLLWWLGTVIFSGTLYALVLTNIRVLGAITPIGGLCLILGWLMLAVDASRSKPNAS